jgi:hypothetical protein
MSNYKFRASAITEVYASLGRGIYVEMEMDDAQAKGAFLMLAGDTRGNELTLWMAELGYTINEIEEVQA